MAWPRPGDPDWRCGLWTEMQAEKRREARERRAERKAKEVAQAIAVRKFLEAVNRYT